MPQNNNNLRIDNPDFQKLQEVEARRRPLQDKLVTDSFALPVMRQHYIDADKKLMQQAQEIASSQDFQNMLAQTGSIALSGLKEIEPLRGVLDEAEITKLEEIFSHQLAAVTDFFERYDAVTEQATSFKEVMASGGMAVSQTVEVDAEPKQETKIDVSQPAKQPYKRKIPPEVIRSTEDDPKTELVVEVVKKGIKFNDKLIGNHYVGTNKNAKVQLLKGASTFKYGSEKKPAELFDIAFPGETYSASRIRDAINAINSYAYQASGKIIFKDNGLATTARAYTINPYITLRMVDSPAETTSPAALPRDMESAKSAKTVESPSHIQSQLEAFAAKDLTAAEAYIVALHLKRFNVVLDACGLPIITDELLSTFSATHIPDNSHMRGNAQAIGESRTISVKKLQALLDDEQKFSEFITNSQPEDPLFQFVEYLTKAAGDDGLELINLLMKAKICNESKLRPNGGGIDKLVRFTVVDEQDRIIFPIEHNQIGIILKALPGHDQPILSAPGLSDEADTAEGSKSLEEVPGRELVPTPADTSSNALSASKTEKVLSSARLEFRGFISRKANEFIETGFDPNKEFGREQITGKIRGFNSNTVGKAWEKGKIGPEDKANSVYTVADVIKILAYNNQRWSNYMKIRGNQKTVDEDVARTVALIQKKFNKANSRHV